jgi:Ca-activated chloride channel homolog
MQLIKNLEFQYPFFSIFFLIPVGAVLVLYFGARKKGQIIQRLGLPLPSTKGNLLGWLLTSLGFILCVVALMGPKIQVGEMEINREGLDIYVLIDTSKSMLVEDVAPSRIERSKKIIADVLGQLSGDRIGYIPFSSSAYIQMPLTDDYNLAGMFLKSIDTDMISGGGTDIGQAIRLAEKSFEASGEGDRVILILSDGEDHNQKTKKVIESVSDHQLKIYTIGVGTLEGGMIPVFNDDQSVRTGFKKDEKGELIMSKLDEASLKALTHNGNGQYFTLTVDDQVSKSLIRALSTLKKDRLNTKSIPQYEQKFQWFLLPGVLLLMLGLVLRERRSL